MGAIDREIKEGRQKQGVDEEVDYTLTTTAWGSTPTAPSVTAYDITNGARTDATATVLSGSASVADDVIALPTVKSLTADHLYRVEVKFTTGGSTFEAYAEIEASY